MSCLRSTPTPFECALEQITLPPHTLAILKERYVRLLAQLRWRARRLSLLFHTARTVITVGSLLVPALLSIQYTDATVGTVQVTEQGMRIYWAAWTVSLFVTMCNGLLTMFKIDKHYYYVHTTMEQLTSEGWQFLELTGKYSGFFTPGIPPTHENQFIFFTHAVEKIRMRQVEEEYYKLTEPASQQGQHIRQDGQPAHAPPTGFIPPTPLQGELARLPPELQRAVAEQLSAARLEDGGSVPVSGRQRQENQENQTDRQAQSVPVSSIV